MMKWFFSVSPNAYDEHMVPLLPGWQRRCSADATLLIHPAGAFAGAVHYQERVRPLQRMPELIARALSLRPMLVVDRIEPSARLVTMEGEYAGHAVIRGHIDGQPAECHVAAVFAEDFQSLLQGVVTQPALFAEFADAVRSLVVLDSHGLGLRRRRFLYAVPAGWQGLRRSFSAEWLPAGFPRDATSITVFPANPLSVPGSELLQHMLNEERQQGADITVEPLPLPSVASLFSIVHQRLIIKRPDRGPVYRQWAALSDSQYSYVAQLESLQPEGLARHSDAFLTLLRTIEPLPRPASPPVAGPPQTIDLWGTD